MPLFTEVRGIRILRTSALRSSRKYTWPRSCADNTHGDALWALLERALRREAKGASGSSSTFRERMLRSPQMPCRLAEAANRGVPKCSLTGCRRAPGAHSPQQDDPGRRDAEFDSLGALPAFLPARVAADFGVEPDAGAFRL